MCNKLVRNRKTGISAPCPIKGLHEFEGQLYCHRHFKSLTKAKGNTTESPKPTESHPPKAPEPEVTITDSDEEVLSSAEEEPEVGELSTHQRAILNKVAMTEDEVEEPKPKKRVKIEEDPEVPLPKKSSILDSQKGLFVLCAFAGLEIMEGVVSKNFVDITGTIQEVRNIEEARAALDELLESLIPDDILEVQADPLTRLLTIIFLVAINKYRENAAHKILSNPDLKNQLDTIIKSQQESGLTSTSPTCTQ